MQTKKVINRVQGIEQIANILHQVGEMSVLRSNNSLIALQIMTKKRQKPAPI